jgi:hypothetical protein
VSTATTDSQRWTVRAASVSDCVDQLSQIWSAAAEEAEHADLTEEQRQVALGDPRLAGRLDPRHHCQTAMALLSFLSRGQPAQETEQSSDPAGDATRRENRGGLPVDAGLSWSWRPLSSLALGPDLLGH